MSQGVFYTLFLLLHSGYLLEYFQKNSYFPLDKRDKFMLKGINLTPGMFYISYWDNKNGKEKGFYFTNIDTLNCY